MVVLHHESYWSGYQIASGGYLAVDVFFVLSGFVIAHSYDARLGQGMSTRQFTLIRAIRFWPLYMVGLLLGLAVEILMISTHNHYAQPLANVIATAVLGTFFLPTLFHTRFDGTFPLNNVSWSLFFELIVNILYSAIFRWLTMRVLLIIALCSCVLLTYFAMRAGSLDIGFNRFSIFPGLVRTVFSFSLGVIIYRSKYRKLSIPLWVLTLVLVALLAAPVLGNWRVVYDLLAVVLVSPAIVLAGSSSQPGPLLEPLATRLGLVSYAIYTVHRPLISLADTATRRLHPTKFPAVIMFTVGVVVLGFWLNEHFDKPTRRWLIARFGLTAAPKPRESSLP